MIGIYSRLPSVFPQLRLSSVGGRRRASGGAAHHVPVGHTYRASARAVLGDALVSRPRTCVGVLPAAHAGEARAEGGLERGAKDGPIATKDLEGA